MTDTTEGGTGARYGEALDFLAGLMMFGVRSGTERLAVVLGRLGSPERGVPSVHIAGTNGKGSTAALCASILCRAAREEAARTGRPRPRRIGLYTSPHLLRVRERIQLSREDGDGLRECTEAEFCAALARVRAAAALEPAVTLTFFEVLTATAFAVFAAAGVEAAVIETGLGGRLDATRLCEARVTVVTSIGWDHMEVLGPTLPAIAREKAGVFRAGVPALVACADDAARAVLIAEARRVGAEVAVLGAAEPGVAVVAPLDADLLQALPLAGAHQAGNAALAVAAVQALDGPLAPALHDRAVVAAGLRAARWPGRLERFSVRRGANPGAIEVWLDAAHNPEGADVLARWMEAQLGSGTDAPIVVVFGVVAGKRLAGMAAPLSRASRLIVTRPPSPRGRPAAELVAELADGALLPAALPVTVEDDWQAAVRAALQAPAGARVVIFGSIFLIGAARGLLTGEPADVLRVQDPGAAPR